MTRLVSAILARNEAGEDRYLARVLARCAEFSDAVLVLDDGSTDDTAAVARAAGCVVVTRDAAGFWGTSETPARRELWERAADLAGDGWVLMCDADMVLRGDPRRLCASWDAAAWAWPLVDLWNTEHTFRVDGPWGLGPTTPRPWLFRPRAAPPGFVARWPENRNIHVGHCPLNWQDAGPTFVAPPNVYWLHFSYLTAAHRRAKFAQYARVTHQLDAFQRAHAATICDGDNA